MASGRVERATVTVMEAAQFLGVSKSLAWEMVWSGRIPSIRLAKRVLIPRSALERLLETGGQD